MQTSNKKVNTTGFFDLSFIIFAFSLEIRCVTVENMDVLGQNINMLEKIVPHKIVITL